MKRFLTSIILRQGVLLALAVSIVCIPIQARGQAPQVRMKWQDFISGPAGAARLASLKRGIARMKSLDNSTNALDFRRSWKYWANIHGYYGARSVDGTVAQQIAYLNSVGLGRYVSYYQGISDQTPPDSVAAAVWATCQHSSGPGAGQANFFGWHRMYLYYFERVLRWAANDNTLRLPYWDYTNPGQEVIPAEFRSMVSPMYDNKRDPGMNAGTSKLNSNSTNVNSKLNNPIYLSYEYDVERSIHGYVHCTVGPTCPVAHMGDVPVAGNDPVFYSHHANIDRLWACWQNLHQTQPGPWLNQQFTFPDENGTPQTHPVSMVLNSAPLGYVYDNTTSCYRGVTKGAITNKLMAQALTTEERFPTVVATSSPLALHEAQTSVDIAVPVAKLRSLAVAPAGSTSSLLVLRDIKADSAPGTLLDVYVATQGQPATRQFVGTVNWFGAFRHHGQTAPDQRTLEFDVTEQLRALKVSTATPGLTISFEATDGRVPATGARPLTIRPEVAKAFRREANLQIGAIELRQAK